MANEGDREQPHADRTRGVRTHAARRRETTWERLKAAIERLEAEGRPVSVRTIQEVSGMEYNSYGRNAKARALYSGPRCQDTKLVKDQWVAFLFDAVKA